MLTVNEFVVVFKVTREKHLVQQLNIYFWLHKKHSSVQHLFHLLFSPVLPVYAVMCHSVLSAN